MDFETFYKSLTSDELWMDTMKMIHRGKNIEEAIKQSYGHLIADEDRHKAAGIKEFKTLVNTWLCGKRPEVKKGKRDISKL